MRVNIVDILKQYKEKKARVETTYARILAWERILCDPTIEFYGYELCNREIGMPKVKNTSSQVEKEAFRTPESELTRELIEEWIKEDRNRIYLIEIEVEQIEKAMDGLTTWERYICECKYFENMNWGNIEESFNKIYSPRNYITYRILQEINTKALKKLYDITKHYFCNISV